MASFTPKKITGKWKQGYALDLHTSSSQFIGYNESGHPLFDTKYSDVGNLLHQLKSKGDSSVVPQIVKAVEEWMKKWKPDVDLLIPVPPNNLRKIQPVLVMAEAISERLKIPIVDCVKKTRDISQQLKNVSNREEKRKLLDGLHTVDKSAVQGKKILLFDDLYSSGETMSAITTVLHEQGHATAVFALAITQTRSRK